jgi:hypothetical protein
MSKNEIKKRKKKKDYEGFELLDSRGKKKKKSLDLYIWFSLRSQKYKKMIKNSYINFWLIAKFGQIFLGMIVTFATLAIDKNS